LALWFIDQSYYLEGNLHGSQTEFNGIGIIFDTYKNLDKLHVHKDISVLVNKGDKDWKPPTKVSEIIGCDANFRFHNERGDFSVTDASRAKITVSRDR